MQREEGDGPTKKGEGIKGSNLNSIFIFYRNSRHSDQLCSKNEHSTGHEPKRNNRALQQLTAIHNCFNNLQIVQTNVCFLRRNTSCFIGEKPPATAVAAEGVREQRKHTCLLVSLFFVPLQALLTPTATRQVFFQV